MSLGLLGKKLGMTRIFDDNGNSIPVTVLLVENNRVVQVKTTVSDGYNAAQITFGYKKPRRVSKGLKGHCSKAGVEAGSIIHEFTINEDDLNQIQLGQNLSLDIFSINQAVDVTGTSKGKGFCGVIKRHHFRSNRASHGNSRSHNTPGSIGQRQDPGRVFPGKKMAGHLGDKQRTAQNLTIVKIDIARNLILVKGAIPGSKDGYIIIKPSVKVGK